MKFGKLPEDKIREILESFGLGDQFLRLGKVAVPGQPGKVAVPLKIRQVFPEKLQQHHNGHSKGSQNGHHRDGVEICLAL